ncbi:aminotransferase class I/II-fold pyridoxal phosphate-dependent enzyme [Azospirillum argentinense]
MSDPADQRPPTQNSSAGNSSGPPAIPETPLADALLAAAGSTRASFHALPVSRRGSIRESALADAYDALFGRGLFSEATITAPPLDSFFFPHRSLARAEELAARAFGATGTLFVTAGTTTANLIALEALIARPDVRVLADKGTHQSIHFALSDKHATVDYIEPRVFCEHSERAALSLPALLEQAAAAEHAGTPYELLVLNGQSYDGVVYDIRAILTALAEASPSLTTVFVDEAWGAWSYFHEATRGRTALHARTADPALERFTVVATHSAHKSLSALRQGSLIHFSGDPDLAERLRLGRYRHHTTSPSYPILASLDLARAQMELEGRDLVERSLRLARRVSETVAGDPALSAFSVNAPAVPDAFAGHAAIDPTKLSLRVSGLPIEAPELRERLYSRHGLYVNRCTRTSLLLNLHIGIGDEEVAALLDALRAIQRELSPAVERPDEQAGERRVSTSFIIPYPPGVPIIVPGEEIGGDTLRRIEAIRSAGARIYTIEHRPR